MNATTNNPQDDDDMPVEIDFSQGVRGKFHHANAQLNMPVYLDQEVQAYLTNIASRQGVALSALANDLLKREIGIIEAVK
jgi:hypothetical protein